MTEYATAEEITSDLELPGEDVAYGNKKVRVRGLSRGEVFAMNKAKQDGGIKDELEWERRMVSIALVQPKMTDAQVATWQRGPAGGTGLDEVTEVIARLSGLTQGADKSGVPSVRSGSDDGIRVLPSDQVGHDGGPTAPPDEQ
jgi:hypothetical protein